MRSTLLCCAVLCLIGVQVHALEPECLAALLEPMAVTYQGAVTIVYYGDDGGRLHRLDDSEGLLRETNQVGVPASVCALDVADLDGDGTIEVVLATSDGQISIYEGKSLGALWRGADDNYSAIHALTLANVDQDPPLEILVLADEHLVIYDGSTHFKEWTSPEPSPATDVLVADVDGDGELEIVLNSGKVLSTVFYQTEWEAGEPFGMQLLLLDMDGDETPEVVGWFEGGGLRIFSVKDRQEIW